MPSDIAISKPLMILILNGGGIRGYASLCILEEVERKCKELLGNTYTEEFKPCTVFNIIGGVSTGAIVALMLGRLEMTIAQCKREYEKFARIIFGDGKIVVGSRLFLTWVFGKNNLLPYLYKTDGLEAAIDTCLTGIKVKVDELLVPEADSKMGKHCTVLIPVIEVGKPQQDGKLGSVERVLSTHAGADFMENIDQWTIKQTIMAATSAPVYFPSYEHPKSKKVFLDAAICGYSNPSVLIYKRIKRIIGHRKEALLLDVGTGTHDPSRLSSEGSKDFPTISTWMSELLTGPRTAAQMAHHLCNGANREETYFRLDVVYPASCKPIKIVHYKRLEEIALHVEAYIQQSEPSRVTIDKVAKRIVKVINGEYDDNRTVSERHERLYYPCNRADPNSGVCFYNSSNKDHFLSCTSSTRLPYTSSNLPESFRKFEEASEIISQFYEGGLRSADDTEERIPSAIQGLKDMLREQANALEVAQHDPTLLSEITLTFFKLSIAHDIAQNTTEYHEAREGVKQFIFLTEGRSDQNPGLAVPWNPCEWFSIAEDN